MKKLTILSGCTLLALISSTGCGKTAGEAAPEPVGEASLEPAEVCSPVDVVATVSDLSYPQQDCTQATELAETKLEGHHYHQACQESAADPSLGVSVSAAHVTDCRATEGRGVFVDVEVCCHESAEELVATETVARGEGPDCPGWRTLARAEGLHYPEADSCGEIVPQAESDLGMAHYRKACEAAAPRATRPTRALEARVVECRTGGDSGVVIDVELCCEAKVFDERDFYELVWRRPPEEVRAALGEPERITEWPQGPHWHYPLEVARNDRVFPEVTVVFVDGRVDSYSF